MDYWLILVIVFGFALYLGSKIGDWQTKTIIGPKKNIDAITSLFFRDGEKWKKK